MSVDTAKSAHSSPANISLKSLTSRLRVFQNFETSEVMVLIGDDISSCPDISHEESEEWFEVTISRFQEKYFGSLNDTLNRRGLLVGSAADKKDIHSPTLVFNADQKFRPLESHSFKQDVKIIEDTSHDSYKDWSPNRIEVDSKDVPKSEPKCLSFCPFCSTNINDENHVLICATSKAIKDKFDESDFTIQMVASIIIYVFSI